jgi:hypothetical protein
MHNILAPIPGFDDHQVSYNDYNLVVVLVLMKEMEEIVPTRADEP